MPGSPPVRHKLRLLTARRRRAGLAALLPVTALLAAVLTASPASPASAATEYVGNLYAASISLGNNLMPCLDAWKFSHDPYTVVTSYPCDAADSAEMWAMFDPSPNVPGLVYASDLTGHLYGACLDVENQANYPGAPVILWPCDSNDVAQQWEYLYTHELYNPHANECLDIPNWIVTPTNAENPVQLEVWPCKGTSNQVWSFTAGNLLGY